ncbi:pilus assembly protein PilZ [Methylobacterium sp. Leaf456]|uniref:PilZ domain-containing protein n=1 Tax=Methylobacterium sp. Leaf456 TaxID=1736382 RepID=UPI0006F9F74C|nr:PilZ domain-containing protein [Methylobacterium sp. Leaf456]KQT56219.1 pilus assembly protein PilZ [Methylobacterium sp. Leaf456]
MTTIPPASPPADRHALILPALCGSRQHSDFYAVTEDITAQGIGFRSSVVPEIDARITCSISFVGTIETRVVANGPSSFGVRLSVPRERAVEIARTLVELARGQDHQLGAVRRHKRITPRRRDVLVTLGDGGVVPGRIVNVSASGAAVFLARPVPLGASVTLGLTAGRVVRLFTDCIGVAFDDALDPARLDSDIRL